jgi:molybdate transport system substrate-binding protein
VTVFAASSLTGAFEQIGEMFTEANPDIDLVFSFAASSELAAQVSQGAPADVFASADTTTMDRVTEEEEIAGTPTVFATNSAEIIVESGNPRGITGLSDLAVGDVTVVLCSPEVPCGRYATSVLQAAGVSLTAASFEQNVKGVVSKVTLGEADAGIVYRTDVLSAGDRADGVPIPDAVNVQATYPIVRVSSEQSADAFIAFVLGEAGQAVLAAEGFGPP